MERQLQQLVRLTDDLLDVSRITRNRIELRRDRIDLRNVLRSAVETIEPLSEAAGHSIVLDLPDAGIWVYGDFTRLAQAFANLLNNAVKYTDRGGSIAMAASIDADEAVIAVSDTGIGIDPAVLPQIFDMFMQAEQGVARPRSGLGIGLTLARRLIELHEGRIDVRSGGRGEGTTFFVRLPIVNAVSESKGPATGQDEAGPSCRVLVAEDIPDAAEMMRLMIKFMGHEVRIAADGVEAVEMAREFEPQIALLDIGMPRMDGYEAARQIRAAMGGRVVLVALTGFGQEDDQRRAYEAGFDRHVTKPAEPDVLEELIASAAVRHPA
jgi:CheY-like chemotaxis protein/anti-sigma regulatory factor (Ser/Thr protein kinase)